MYSLYAAYTSSNFTVLGGFCAGGSASRGSNVVQVLDSPETVIRTKLDDGEQLLWSGQPRQGLLLQPMDAALIPFSLLWGGFAFYWEYEVVTSHQFWVLQLWGIPFVLLGLYLVVGRFFMDSYLRSQTYYGLTDKRVIIQKRSAVQSISLADLTSVTLADKIGTLVFGTRGLPSPSSAIAYFQPTRGPQYPMFHMIPDAKSVYDQIEAQRRSGSLSISG